MSGVYRIVVSALTGLALLASSARAESSSVRQPASAHQSWLPKAYIPPGLLGPHPNLRALASLVVAHSYTFTELINAPKPSGINNSGVIANSSPGFTITPPYTTANIKGVGPFNPSYGGGPFTASVYAIDRNGDVAGGESDNRGFFQLANGIPYLDFYPAITVGDLSFAVFFGGNSHGVLVGKYNSLNADYGFVYRIGDFTGDPLTQGSYYVFDPPGSYAAYPNVSYNSVALTGVNERDDIVGYFFDPRPNSARETSFVNIDFATTEFSVPGSTATVATGINDEREIVGQYIDSAGISHGFIYNGGPTSASASYMRLDYPGSSLTGLSGVNDNGDIVGVYSNDGATYHGFIAKRN